MDLVGYLLAVVIGLLLSLLGGGGSIMTVPVLVYIFRIDPPLATAYSLLIVGSTSAMASINYLRKRLASPKTALFFSFPSFVMVFATRKYLMPLIPEKIVQFGDFILTKNGLIMITFAVLMVLASRSMIRKRQEVDDISEAIRRLNYSLIFIEGLLVGTLTGFVGVGGGFLIIPVLTNFVKLPMKLAVGTSLIIIAINSLIGFTGDLGKHSLDWIFLGIFISLSLVGVLIGTTISKRLDNQQLKPAFGWFTLVMGAWILLKELVF
ncbi:MAG: sulfite exporter TauE/SafE family protein [Arcicella sp.]|jgi:hypothetical protein|nr:sulfite exporter TauE/SafE family protein [Arcicella sp.]